ncbi:MAG: hypothetical protein RJA99_3461 [Pseudomonadota bacterium]
MSALPERSGSLGAMLASNSGSGWKVVPSARIGHGVEALAVVLCALAASVVLALVQGPSWSWDRAHYHVYAAHQWIEGLLGRGFLPGGPQSFLNPLAYVPAALLERAGWSPRSIAVLVAAFQSACVWVVYAIARDRTRSAPAAWAAAALALFTPLYVTQLGSSYIDATTTVFVLVGVWACRRAGDRDRSTLRWAAAGGLAMGLAVGLKLSHVFPALLAPILFAASGGTPVIDALRRALRALAVYGIAAAVGLTIAHGSWGADLRRLTGNPFHPLMGSLFARPAADAPSAPTAVPDGPVAESPLAAASPPDVVAPLVRLSHVLRASGGRFVPESMGDVLLLPLRLADPRTDAPLVYVEWRAPDPRLLWLGVLLLAGGLAATVRRLRSRAEATGEGERAAPPPDGPLLAFLAVWYVVWVFTSANGRYGIGLLMLCSVPLVQAAVWWLRSARPVAWLLGTAITIQGLCAVVAQDPADRYVEIGWDEATLAADMPDVLRERPTLHLLTSTFSWSYLLPRMHPDSTFANVHVGCDADRCDPAVTALVDARRASLRTFVQADTIRDGRPSLSAAWVSLHDARLAPIEGRVDPSGCEYFQVRPIVMDVKLFETTAAGTEIRRSTWVASCPVVPAPGAAAAYRAAASRYDDLFDRIHSACVHVLGPDRSRSEWSGKDRWIRRYPYRDLDIMVSPVRVVARNPFRGARVVGATDALRAGDAPIDCEAVAVKAGPPVDEPLLPGQ